MKTNFFAFVKLAKLAGYGQEKRSQSWRGGNMNQDIFIASLEDEWKELSTEARGRRRRLISRFSPEELARIFDELLRICRYNPRVADIYTAAENLNLDLSPRKPEKKGCAECRGTTWIYVTVHHPITGEPYEAVKTCACTTRKIKFTPDMFVHGDKHEDEVPF